MGMGSRKEGGSGGGVPKVREEQGEWGPGGWGGQWEWGPRKRGAVGVVQGWGEGAQVPQLSPKARGEGGEVGGLQDKGTLGGGLEWWG